MRGLVERALAIEEREYGPDHREVAVTLENLGWACGRLGDAAKERGLLGARAGYQGARVRAG